MQRCFSGFVSAITVAQGTNANTCGHQVVYQPASVITRPQIYDVVVGCAATPADNAIQWALMRSSTAPTGGSAITPSPVDTLDTTTTLDMSKPTGGNTLGVFLLYISVNQRVTFRWCAVPGGELVLPATAGSGIALVSYLAATPAVSETTVFWRE